MALQNSTVCKNVVQCRSGGNFGTCKELVSQKEPALDEDTSGFKLLLYTEFIGKIFFISAFGI